MNIKSKQEIDPSRCRTLRQSERQINGDLGEITAAIRSLFRELKDLGKLRSDLGDKAKNLKVQIGAATIASGGRGAIGHVIGGFASRLTTELEVLRSRINALDRQIETARQKSEDYKSQKTRLDASLKENARQLTELNCVK